MFKFRGKILVLRLFRLGRIPSALYSTELMVENGLPCLVYEFGNLREPQQRVVGKIPRLRVEAPWVEAFPRKFRSMILLAHAAFDCCRRTIQTGRPALIYAHGLQESVLAFLLFRVFRIPYVVHVHEVYEPEFEKGWNRILLALEGRVLEHARFILFSERGRAQIYQERFKLTPPILFAANCPRLRTREKGIDLRRSLKLPTDAVLAIYVGGLGDPNALGESIGALPHFPNLHLVLLGWHTSDYFLNRLRELSKGIGVDNRVHFLGEVPDKWPYLDGVDFSLCVYKPIELRFRHLATASNKLMESLAAGLPVVTSGQPDFKEIVDKYDVGICLETISPEGFRRAFSDLLADPGRLRQQSGNGVRVHRDEFHYERQFKQALEQIKRLVAEAKSGAVLPLAGRETEDAVQEGEHRLSVRR